MPYIKKERRKDYDKLINRLDNKFWMNEGVNPAVIPVGDLNYVVSSLCWKLFDRKPSYQRINDIIGALECIKLEFYRRKAEIYEQEKCKLNGDI